MTSNSSWKYIDDNPGMGDLFLKAGVDYPIEYMSRLTRRNRPVIIFRNPPASIRAIYFICLAGASANHAYLNMTHGLFWDYGGVPLLSSVFWTSLTFLDPLAALLLLLSARCGVVMTAVIIVTDVLHNTWLNFYLDVAAAAPYFAQLGFLLFVGATAHIAWRTEPRKLQPGA